MDKEKIKQRINELKLQNDNDNNQLININQMQQTILQQILIRNGRILELEELIKELYCGGII